jgi:hypothetical protein
MCQISNDLVNTSGYLSSSKLQAASVPLEPPKLEMFKIFADFCALFVKHTWKMSLLSKDIFWFKIIFDCKGKWR